MKPLNDFTAWPKFSVMDMEARTRPGESFGLDVCCVCHTDEFGNRKAFKDVTTYLDWVFTLYQGEIIWAHWGGRYDHRFIIWEATKRNWSWQAMISGNLIIILIVTNGNGKTIKFCDSSRLMPDSVASIGKTVGLEKFKEDRTAIDQMSWDQVTTYCYRDCDIVLRGLQQMRTTLLSVGCDFAFTLASIATRYVRRSGVLNLYKFYEKDKLTGKYQYSKMMQQADKFAWAAYFGGRVEVFRLGMFDGPLYYYDITSSYPKSMTFELPSYFWAFEPPLKSLEKSLQKCGISEATVHIPQRAFYANILAVKNHGKLTFPWGNFRGRWTNVELMELWKRGRDKGVKIELHGQSVYEPLPFLRPFVETFYGLRREALENSDSFQSYAFKIFQNALYGKLTETSLKRSVLFGDLVDEAIEQYGDLVITNDYEALTKAMADEAGIPDSLRTKMIEASETPGVYMLNTLAEGPFKHVAAGSYVTALSRLRLLDGIEACLAAGARVFYSDTDSIITDKPVFPDVGKQLGEWHLEHIIQKAEIYSSKVYKMTTSKGEVIYKAKGMQVDSEEKWNQFTGGLRGEQHPKAIKAGIRGFLTDIAHGSVEPKSFELKRQMLNGDLKRNHLEDGDSEALWYSNLDNLIPINSVKATSPRF